MGTFLVGQITRHLFFMLAILATSVVSAAQDCSKEIAAIQARLAEGEYPQQNVMLATQLQSSLEQMCAYLDEKARAELIGQLETLLPTMSKEELRAQREMQAAAEEAIEELSRNAEVRNESQWEAVENSVLKAGATATSKGGQYVDRADLMTYLWIWDWDTYQGNLRILYSSFPDRVQYTWPDWKFHVYVVEVGESGNIVQHHVTSKQEAGNYGGLALRRGYDEVLFHRRSSNTNDTGVLQRWSISGGELLTSVQAPNPLWPDGTSWDWGPFRLPTSDGNVLFAQTRAGKSGGRSEVGWFEAAPDGRVLGQGVLADTQHSFGAAAWFSTENGGGGLMLDITNHDAPGVRSAVETPLRYEIGGRKIHAFINREHRLIVTSDNASGVWESGAVERDLGWGGDLAIPESLSPTEKLTQTNEYLRLTRRVSGEYDANRTVETLNVGAFRLPMVKPMKNGYGVLVKATGDRRANPPIHGSYLLKVDDTGVHKKAYLEPYAEQLNAQFRMLGISGNDDVYLYATALGNNESDFVIRLDNHGKPESYGRTADNSGVVMEGVVGDTAGAWLFGYDHLEDNRAMLWIERMDFNR